MDGRHAILRQPKDMKALPVQLRRRTAAHVPSGCLRENRPDHSAMRDCQGGIARGSDFSKQAARALENHPRAFSSGWHEIQSLRLVGKHCLAELRTQVCKTTALPVSPTHLGKACVACDLLEPKQGSGFQAALEGTRHCPGGTPLRR